jgi:multidrug efflux pump subunit AcrB
MFERFLRFFVENSRMNYTLFFLIFAIGIWSYQKMPKEVFPSFELDMVSITGNYTGASVDILDKMAVVDIENNIKSLDGVKDMTTVISSGKFSIILEFEKGKNRYDMLNKTKDAVALTLGNLPSDMDEPNVKLVTRSRDLVDISLTSDKYTVDEMKRFAENFKNDLFGIKGVNDVSVFGDSDRFFEIKVDEEKLIALGINQSSFFDALKTVSYIFPIGKIEDLNGQYYLSTYNGAKDAQELQNFKIKVADQLIYIKDVASVQKKYEDSSTLYSFNGKNSLSLSVKQNEKANALVVVKGVKKLIEEKNKLTNDITITISDDNSKRVVDRLNIVTSNITLGIILITLLVALLINFRMALVIVIGIPTSFVIASLYMYLSGYSINMITLVGVLIAIGIVVDDAIVVSEHIQQLIEDGMEPKEAAIIGAKEMFLPVTIASITTLFSFLPILMLGGTMGLIMQLIPIAVSALVVASLIESFVFLPIHASHILKSNTKVTSWEKANKIYSSIIHFFMKWKKTFIVLFIILVPVLTYIAIQNSKFQMFPQFDATDIKISIKANKNSTLNNSYEIVKAIEHELVNKADEFHIKSIDSIAGYRRDTGSNTERNPYVMYMTLELRDAAPTNFVDKYITPVLSFYHDGELGTRDLKSRQISKKLSKFIQKKKFKEKYNLEEIVVLQKKVGPIKSDIKIGLVGNNHSVIESSMETIESKLRSIEGVVSIQNSVKYGIDEIKIKINDYGKSLGITEGFIGSYLANLYLTQTKTKTIDEIEIVDIKVQSKNKDDFKAFKKLEIPFNNQMIKLTDIADLVVQKSFEQIIKDKGLTNFYIYANVDAKIITSTEVINQLNTILNSIKKQGIKLVFKGEAEKKRELKNDMLAATALALILIMLSMLYLFNSFRETLIVMSVIPFSFLGVMMGLTIMDLNMTMPAIIGALGLAGVVINDGIIMMTYLKKAKTIEEVFYRATRRFRPIILTTITTLIGMSTLIFFASGEAIIFQPIAVALGFGLAWGTILNLIYLPVLFTFLRRLK